MEKTGAELIAEERQRQIEQEGWTAEHDDAHNTGDLQHAAIAYIAESIESGTGYVYWPWQREWWKPKDRISNLKRAGALIAAEIDRLNREQNKEPLIGRDMTPLDFG